MTVDWAWSRWLDRRDLAARDRLLVEYLPLVHAVARKLCAQRRFLRYPEVVSDGTIGLLTALDRYNPNLSGGHFEPYAVQRIRWAVTDSQRAADRIPHQTRERASRYRQARDDLHRTLGRPATVDEIAGHLDTTPRAVRRAALDTAACAAPVSIDETGHDDASPLADSLIDLTGEQPGARLERAAVAELVDAAAGRVLNRQQRYVVDRYFRHGDSIRTIAAALDVSESRISQIKNSAVVRLRRALAAADAL